MIGHGAGYGQIDKLIETFKDDVDLFYNVDPVAAQLLDAKSLTPGLGDLTAEMVKRYKAAAGAQEVPPHTSMGFNQAWIFLTRAAVPQEARRFRYRGAGKAAIEPNPVAEHQGYGVSSSRPEQDGGPERALLAGGDAYVKGAQERLAVRDQDHDRCCPIWSAYER